MPDLRMVTALPQSLRPAYEALLASAGLRDEGDADCTALLSSDGGALLACGSVSGRVLKQIAVAPWAAGDGACARIVTALLEESARRRILIEYSAPNTNKPQHLGHVRNNTLGMSLASLLKRVGHDVIEINLVNDRGIHICKSMIAYERFGNGCTPESTGMKGDHLVGKFYVDYNRALSEEIRQLRESDPSTEGKSDEELFLATELGSATQKMLQQWEAGDPEVRGLL